MKSSKHGNPSSGFRILIASRGTTHVKLRLSPSAFICWNLSSLACWSLLLQSRFNTAQCKQEESNFTLLRQSIICHNSPCQTCRMHLHHLLKESVQLLCGVVHCLIIFERIQQQVKGVCRDVGPSITLGEHRQVLQHLLPSKLQELQHIFGWTCHLVVWFEHVWKWKQPLIPSFTNETSPWSFESPLLHSVFRFFAAGSGDSCFTLKALLNKKKSAQKNVQTSYILQTSGRGWVFFLDSVLWLWIILLGNFHTEPCLGSCNTRR